MTLAYHVAEPASDAETARSLWIDRMRSILTALVIFHHAAITYGASGSWFYKATTTTDPLLTLIAAVDQSFFMGAFFLIAGYLAPMSLTRKGSAAFLADRVLRLGLPSAAFALLLGPVTVALAAAPPTGFWATATDAIGHRPVLGPMWFPVALLVLSAFVPVLHRPYQGKAPVPPFHHWLLGALALGLVTLLVRQVFPVGNAVLDMQLGYFPGYVTFFALGLVASRHRWLDRLPRGFVRKAALPALAVFPLLPVVLLAMSDPVFETGFALPAITYALWEPLIALGIVPALILWAQSPSRLPSAFWSRAAANSYGAFVLHAPLLVIVCRLLDHAGTPKTLALPVATLITALLAFHLAAILRRSAAVRRVL